MSKGAIIHVPTITIESIPNLKPMELVYQWPKYVLDLTGPRPESFFLLKWQHKFSKDSSVVFHCHSLFWFVCVLLFVSVVCS